MQLLKNLYNIFQLKKIIGLIILSIILQYCSLSKKLKDNEYLIDNVKYKTEKDKLDNTLIYGKIRQKPNHGILKLNLRIYNSIDSTRLSDRKYKKIEKKNKRIQKRNEKSISKGKKNQKPLIEYDNYTTIGEKLKYKIGESPIILDTNLCSKICNELNIYMKKVGYFDNNVSYKIDTLYKIEENKGKVRVTYNINKIRRYIIDSVIYNIEDENIAKFNLKEKSKIIKDNYINFEILDAERNNISYFLKDNAYYFFDKSFIDYELDSNSSSSTVKVIMNLGKNIEDTSLVNHKQYTINKINVTYFQDDKISNPTITSYKDINYIVYGNNDFRISLIYNSIFFKIGENYSIINEEKTYKSLINFEIFRSVKLRFEKDNKSNNGLILNITIYKNKTQSTNIEFNGTNSGSVFGVNTKLYYSHYNIAKSGSLLNLGFNGEIEAQPLLLIDSSNINVINSSTNFSSRFNTIIFGPSVRLDIPRLLFIKKIANHMYDLKTYFASSLYYQRKLNKTDLDFEQTIQNLIFGYNFRISSNKYHNIEPINISVVNITMSKQFQEELEKLNNYILMNSFVSHINIGLNYNFIYKDYINHDNRKLFTYNFRFESKGNLMRFLYDKLSKEKKETYEIFKTSFSQYIKNYQEIKYTQFFNKNVSIASRLGVGLGIPLNNSPLTLPFEKSFYSGGINNLRAWQARNIGPGSYRDSNNLNNKIGEILLESNLELRFNILSFLSGAFFIDAGNIWNKNYIEKREGSLFEINKFYKDIAIGVGFGLRFDFSYFIFRVELAKPIKNPILNEGERWIFQSQNEYNNYLSNLLNPKLAPKPFANQFIFGIGLPF